LAGSAYLTALGMLATRELSSYQVRQRLARRGFAADAVDEAITQLTSERALDDTRTAGAIARTELRVHGHGPSRALRAVRAAGIAADIAQSAIDETFASEDVGDLLRAALDKRLRGQPIADDAAMRRLFRYLVGRGFAPDRVVALLRSRRQ